MAYAMLLDKSIELNASQPFIKTSEEWSSNSRWEMYIGVLDKCALDFTGKVVADLGCKYGHTAPLLMSLGASEVIGIDAETEYVDEGGRIFHQYNDKIRIVPSDCGYLPIETETVDFVLMNEVISHINPSFLDTTLSEVSRILKPNGQILISDGNNLDCRNYDNKLIKFHKSWENGPDGVKTDRDIVTKPFVDRRREIIKQNFPDLDSSSIDMLAVNTFGLYGKHLKRVLEEYVRTGFIPKRVYVPGLTPVNPGDAGAVIERGFHPLQVIMTLDSYGIEAWELDSSKPSFIEHSLTERFKYIVRFISVCLSGRHDESFLRLFNFKFFHSTSDNFTILGRKIISH